MRVAEAEFAFVLGKAMPERGTPYTQAEVMDAVTALHLSIEVPDSRYADFTLVGAPSLIADMACPSWLMLGPAVEADWRGIDLSRAPRDRLQERRRSGGGERQGGARRPAHRAHLAGQRGGAAMAAASRPASSSPPAPASCPSPIAPGDAITMDYGVLGTLSVRIA